MRGQATHCSEPELLQKLWLRLFCFAFKYLYSHWERDHRQWEVSAHTDDSLFKGKEMEWLRAGFVVCLSCLNNNNKKKIKKKRTVSNKEKAQVSQVRCNLDSLVGGFRLKLLCIYIYGHRNFLFFILASALFFWKSLKKE